MIEKTHRTPARSRSCGFFNHQSSINYQHETAFPGGCGVRKVTVQPIRIIDAEVGK
jgi:hypothetical protein